MKIIAETGRLTLREFAAGDATFIQQLLNSPGWLRYIGNRNINSPEDARAYIDERIRNYKEHGFGLWLMELKESGTPIGMCGLVKRAGLDHVDIGFALMPGYEGNGYAFEAASEAMKIAKDAGLKKVAGITVPYNTSSIKLLEKLGLKFEKMIMIPNDNEELMLMTAEL